MKLSTRAKAFYSALAAVIMTTFVAAPAFAHDAAEHEIAGAPVDTGAILIVGVVLLAIVLLLAAWLSNMLGKRG